MGLKNRSKVSAEFSMSSLTDIIFLLLIFFMLTSSLVVPNSLNLKLPGKAAKPRVSKRPLDVKIDRSGTYFLAGQKASIATLDRELRKYAQTEPAATRNITISPHPKTPHEYVAGVMDIAMRFQINAILATKSK